MWSLKFNRYSSQEGAAKWRHGTVLQLRSHLNRLWGDLSADTQAIALHTRAACRGVSHRASPGTSPRDDICRRAFSHKRAAPLPLSTGLGPVLV